MTEESASTSVGEILSDGKCSGDGEMFKAVAARYLAELYLWDVSHTEYRDFLKQSADAAWQLARDPQTGRFTCDWAGPFDAQNARVGSLGSAAVGLAAAAKALGAGTQRPPLTYEAEESDLHGVGLEAAYAGYSGWGYTAGWGSDGQAVDLSMYVPDAGQYVVEFRYATVQDATRTLALDGTDVVQSLSFPSTGGYDVYRTVRSPVLSWAAGHNTLSVQLLTAKGGRGYLNLDRVELVRQ